MNKVWVVLKLGIWSHKATSMFLYDRIYKNGCQWTPFCLKTFRYVRPTAMTRYDTESLKKAEKAFEKTKKRYKKRKTLKGGGKND